MKSPSGNSSKSYASSKTDSFKNGRNRRIMIDSTTATMIGGPFPSIAEVATATNINFHMKIGTSL
jgi:hypothetical protein